MNKRKQFEATETGEVDAPVTRIYPPTAPVVAFTKPHCLEMHLSSICGRNESPTSKSTQN